MEQTVKVFVSPAMNSSEFLDSVTTESTGNEEVSAEKDEDVFNQELQALENADDKEDEDVHKVFRTAAEGIGNNEVHANKESNEKSSGSAMVHVAKTLQLASSWLNKTRAKRTENTPRVDSFLEKLEMAGPSHVTRNSRKLDSSASSIMIDPSGSLHYCWLIIVTISVLYNWIFIIARTAFLDLQINTLSLWLTLDYLSDIIYIVDMVIQFKTGKQLLTTAGSFLYVHAKVFFKKIWQHVRFFPCSLTARNRMVWHWYSLHSPLQLLRSYKCS